MGVLGIGYPGSAAVIDVADRHGTLLECRDGSCSFVTRGKGPKIGCMRKRPPTLIREAPWRPTPAQLAAARDRCMVPDVIDAGLRVLFVESIQAFIRVRLAIILGGPATDSGRHCMPAASLRAFCRRSRKRACSNSESV